MPDEPTTRAPSPLGDAERIAEGRDRRAAARDERAEARDEVAAARDERAEARDRGQVSGSALGAAEDRDAAGQDRRTSGSDRAHAEADREASAEDRLRAARQRAELLVDGLTGAHRREAGLLELEREVMQAHRTRERYLLAFLDVDGLKAINDAEGHAAGDRLLQQVVSAVRGVVREYDLVVRFGGDEFLCGMAGVDVSGAERRFALANAQLAPNRASVSIGLAELEPGEDLDHLIARADADMYERRAVRGSRPPPDPRG